MNITNPLLEYENRFVVDFVQAAIGDIGPNFRRITLETLGPRALRMWFLLEQDLAVDRESIEEIEFSFEALQKGPIEVDLKVVISSAPIAEIALPGRVVFGRREN